MFGRIEIKGNSKLAKFNESYKRREIVQGNDQPDLEGTEPIEEEQEQESATHRRAEGKRHRRKQFIT